MDIAKNIARAIKKEAADGDGITTDFTDAFTEKIEVKPQFTDEVVCVEIIY